MAQKNNDQVAKKLLKNIIPRFTGQSSEKLIDLLYKKQNVNEFLIAKKMELTINQTRNMLYKLTDEGLIEFIRKKDKKKGGWYTYFWTLKTKRILQTAQRELNNELEKLQSELAQRKNERFFYSSSIATEYTEEEAMLNDFTCPETGEVLEIREPKELLTNLQTQIGKLESGIKQLDIEIKDIEEKESKTLERKLKIEKMKKDEERKAKRLERAKEKQKLERKSSKKKITKKKTKKKSVSKKKKKR